MADYMRVHKLGKIPVLGRDGRQVAEAQVTGRMVLPLSLSIPVKGDEALGSELYFLSFSINTSFGENELVYLHEQVPVA